MSEIKHTPLPWLAHSAFYANGIKGDIFAKDAQAVHDATPICRVARPVSYNDMKTTPPPIDELRAIAKVRAEAPIVEANAAFIVEACNSYYQLKAELEKLRKLITDWADIKHDYDSFDGDRRGIAHHLEVAEQRLQSVAEDILEAEDA